MKRLYLALILLVLATWPAHAQSPVTVIGPITANDCVKFNSTTIITDAGFICTGQGILPNATVAGTVLYFNGTAWVIFAGNTSGTNCLGENAVGAPQWTTCAGGSGANPGGSNTQIQYNASSTFGGMSTFTTDGTNLALTAGTLTIKDSGNAVIFNTPSTAQSSCVPFQSNGTTKWTICKNTDDSLSIVDSASTNTVFKIASNGNMTQMPVAGSDTIGNSIYADNSGHPYCDVRAYGAGVGSPSADQTAFATAFTNCSGGSVFIPCGTYSNTATWTVGAGTKVTGAGRGCLGIFTTQTSGDIFVCGGSSPFPTEFSEMSIYGIGAQTTGSVPTAGYAINCTLGGNQQGFYNLEINGTYNGIFIGGTNGRVRDSRIESLYGLASIYAPLGGALIDGNQLDNNSAFNATGGAGFGTLTTYNTSTPVVTSKGTMTQSNGFYFIATVAGTTGPNGSGLPATPMYKNITDGGVTWQLIGNSSLILVVPGTESWITDNDMVSPAAYGVDVAASTSANKVWIRGNNFGGEVLSGVTLSGGVQSTHIIDNQFSSINYVISGVATGYPIWDRGGGDNSFISIVGNTISAPDAAIIIEGDWWVISGNTIQQHNAVTSGFCGIELITNGSSPVGTNITGNFLNGESPGSICMSGGGGSRTTVVGNVALGGTISLSGTNIVNLGNN